MPLRPRARHHIDLLIRSEDLARIRALVATLGYDLSVTLDLVVVAPIYAGVWQDRVRVSWRELTLACVSRDGLLQMKRIAGRPQDLADIHALEGKGDDGA